MLVSVHVRVAEDGIQRRRVRLRESSYPFLFKSHKSLSGRVSSLRLRVLLRLCDSETGYREQQSNYVLHGFPSVTRIVVWTPAGRQAESFVFGSLSRNHLRSRHFAWLVEQHVHFLEKA